MNTLPPEDEDLSDIDALYRRVAASDASVPDDKVRERVHAHAKQLAIRTAYAALDKPDFSWQRPQRRAWRRPTAFAALAAALLAVFMWTPRMSRPPQSLPPVALRAAPRDDTPADGSTVFADIGTRDPVQAEQAAAVVRPAARVARAPAGVPAQAAPSHTAMLAQNTVAPATAAAKSADAAASPEAHGNMATARQAGASAASTAAAAGPISSTPAESAAREDAGPALWRAAESGDLVALRGLHERHANLDLQDGAGRTALMLATLAGHSQAVALLLDAGANPNIQDHSGESPLDAALAADESEIITALKRHGGR